jgi:hypothetical protein
MSHSHLAAVGADGFVSADDVLFLRRNVFRDGVVSTGELDSLFELAKRAPKGDPEWAMFFEEAVADFFLREEEPQGYLTAAEFSALKARCGDNPNPLVLGLLVRLLEKATATPEEMSAFIGDALRRSVLARVEPRITRDDSDLVGRFIYAAGGDGNVAVTRREAELLFDLNDAVRGANNDPAWTDLFSKAIAAHLMAHFTYAAQGREEAVRRHAFVSDRSKNVGGFFKRMLGAADKTPDWSEQALRNSARERDATEAEKVTDGEADWLAERIGADGVFHESERALLERMRDLDAALPPKLQALLDRAA